MSAASAARRTLSPAFTFFTTLALSIALVLSFMALSLIGTPQAAAQDSDEVRLLLLHGIAGIDVDVYSDDEVLVENFQFGDVEDLGVLAGETLEELEVRLAGQDVVAIDAGDVDLPADGSWSIVAHLDEVGEPTLSVFANDTSEIPAGMGRVTIRHVAAAEGATVLVDGTDTQPGQVLVNGQEVSADLDIDTYELEVKVDDETVIGPAPIVLQEGRSLIVYAVGSNNDLLTTITDSYEVTENAPVALPTPTVTPDSSGSNSGSNNSGSNNSGSNNSGSNSGSSDVTTMTETIDNLNSAPSGVETGIGAITVTEFSLSRTLLAVALALVVVLLAITGGFIGLRRRSDSRI